MVRTIGGHVGGRGWGRGHGRGLGEEVDLKRDQYDTTKLLEWDNC